MPYLLGIDEAGYGPNLGPLLITATCWELPPSADPNQLAEHLQTGNAPGDRERVTLLDSKRLFQRQTGIEPLERNTLAAAFPPGQFPSDWQELWQAWAPQSWDQLNQQPWYSHYSCSLPRQTDADEITRLAEGHWARLAETGIRLRKIRSAAICPPQFNRDVERAGSKGLALSTWSLELLRELLCEFDDQPAVVHADRHGGRKSYAPVIQEAFPEQLVIVRGESQRCSSYRWEHAGRQVDASFSTQGEASLAAALASMVCKYLRELAMEAFNDFWRSRLPMLRETAGYPGDAPRFKREIADVQKKLKISDDVLWRKR